MSDDGAGVAAEDRDRVFEPGWRAEPSDGHDGGGPRAGAGPRLARAAGGELRVEQTQTGSTFALDLPPG